MAKPLWGTDLYGERWLENSGELILANKSGRRKGKKMARRKGKRSSAARMMAYVRSFRKKSRAKTNRPKHRRAAKRNFMNAGMIANRPRSRVYVMPRRRPRSNPASGGTGRPLFNMFGLQIPGMATTAGAVAGLVIPGMVQAQIAAYVPASLSSTTIGKWLVRTASVALPAWIVKRFISAKAGTMMFIVGAATLGAMALREFFPTAFPALGQYLGEQPFLGYYGTSGGGQRQLTTGRQQFPIMQPGMSRGVPDRLQAGSRF